MHGLRAASRFAIVCLIQCGWGLAYASDQCSIDRDVWIPFLAASNAFDAEGFISMHAPDFEYVGSNREEVQQLDAYSAGIRSGFARAREKGILRDSEMRFVRRFSSGKMAFDSGYFRSRTTMPDGNVRERFTRFDVLLFLQSDGKWRIRLDQDALEPGAQAASLFTDVENAPGSSCKGSPDVAD